MNKRKIEDFNDAMLTDPANVAAIFKVKESFEDSKRIDWFEKCDYKNYEWSETDWEDVLMDVSQEKYICKRTLLTKSYVDWFLKIVKAFYESKTVNTKRLRLYENKNKESPVFIIYDGLGMLLAPRIDEENKYKFESLKEKKPYKKTKKT